MLALALGGSAAACVCASRARVYEELLLAWGKGPGGMPRCERHRTRRHTRAQKQTRAQTQTHRYIHTQPRTHAHALANANARTRKRTHAHTHATHEIAALTAFERRARDRGKRRVTCAGANGAFQAMGFPLAQRLGLRFACFPRFFLIKIRQPYARRGMLSEGCSARAIPRISDARWSCSAAHPPVRACVPPRS